MSVYKKGDIVWAKVKGYSWWPSVVQESNLKSNGEIDSSVELLYLAENTIGKLSTQRTKDYESNFKKFSTASKSKVHLEAVKIAQEMFLQKKPKTNPRKPEDSETKKPEKKIRKEKLETNDSIEVEPDNQSNSEIKAKGSRKTIKSNLGKQRRCSPQEREPAQHEASRLSKSEKKLQRKEEEKLNSNVNYMELLQRRSTRALSKNNEIEMLSEPLIYHARKIRKREFDPARDQSSFDGSMNEDSNPLHSEFYETHVSISNNEQQKQKINQEYSDGQILAKGSSLNETNNLLIQLETLKKLIEEKEQNDLEEADQEKISKILDEFQNHISSEFLNQKCSKIIDQVVLLLLKNQNSLKINHHISEKLLKIKNRFSEKIENSNHTLNLDNKENTNTQESHIFFRKSVCQKLAKLFEQVYCLEKGHSQELALLIEGRINNYFPETLTDYKKSIKTLCKLIKVKTLQVEDLESVLHLPCLEFKLWIKLKIQNVTNNKPTEILS